jgi:hypothetical protein
MLAQAYYDPEDEEFLNEIDQPLYEPQTRSTTFAEDIYSVMHYWGYAWRQTKDKAAEWWDEFEDFAQEKWEKDSDQLISDGLEKLVDFINSEFADATEEEKGKEIFNHINASMLSPASSPAGDLNASLEYSDDYKAMRITWDRKGRTFECVNEIWTVNMINWLWGGSYTRETYYYRQEASYELYRVVDGVETSITTIDGRLQESRTSYSIGYAQDSGFDPRLLQNLKSYYADTQKAFNIPSDRLFYIDLKPDFRHKDSTLSYKVRAELHDNLKSICNEHRKEYFSTIAADENADGLPDFLPDFVPRHTLEANAEKVLPIITEFLLADDDTNDSDSNNGDNGDGSERR